MGMGSEKVWHVLNDPRAGARKLAEAISLDPALRKLVLKVANSAYYRRQERIHELTRAVILIGFAGVSQLLRSNRL